MNRFVDFLVDAVGVACLVLVAAFIFIGIPAIGYSFWASSRAPTFELRKDQWACTSAHAVTSTIYMEVGKVMVPQTSTTNVCDQWSAAKD